MIHPFRATRPINPVLAASDLSTWGRVALSVGIPSLEKRGIQVCALPTALLSAHGGYTGAVMEGQTSFMTRALAHLETLHPSFSALFTGFIAEPPQFELLEALARRVSASGGFVLVDPVMGDNGKLYGFFDSAFVDRMRSFVSLADLITPNLTEAALLLGKEGAAVPEDSRDLRFWCEGLCRLGPRYAAITSAEARGSYGRTGVALYDSASRRFTVLSHARQAGGYPGTGDFFAAELLAGLLGGATFFRSARGALRRVRRSVEYTRRLGSDAREGLKKI